MDRKTDYADEIVSYLAFINSMHGRLQFFSQQGCWPEESAGRRSDPYFGWYRILLYPKAAPRRRKANYRTRRRSVCEWYHVRRGFAERRVGYQRYAILDPDHSSLKYFRCTTQATQGKLCVYLEKSVDKRGAGSYLVLGVQGNF